jgi:dipeptidyl aminopeptidase/acylaminoacyl peptidase
MLSASGFYVLCINPRGDGKYGTAFANSIRGRLYFEEDWLKGVDAAIAKYPDIDGSRVGVSGGSYGGIATNWLTARSKRFAAAVTSSSYASMETFFGTTDIPDFAEFYLNGTPWEQREVYRRWSPLSYVEHVTAPTLIIHQEDDHRTPMADGEQWFMALKKLGVPVEFVRYPRSSHLLSSSGEPWLLVDRLERLRSWFVHWLIEAPRPLSAQIGHAVASK